MDQNSATHLWTVPSTPGKSLWPTSARSIPIENHGLKWNPHVQGEEVKTLLGGIRNHSEEEMRKRNSWRGTYFLLSPCLPHPNSLPRSPMTNIGNQQFSQTPPCRRGTTAATPGGWILLKESATSPGPSLMLAEADVWSGDRRVKGPLRRRMEGLQSSNSSNDQLRATHLVLRLWLMWEQ